MVQATRYLEAVFDENYIVIANQIEFSPSRQLPRSAHPVSIFKNYRRIRSQLEAVFDQDTVVIAIRFAFN